MNAAILVQTANRITKQSLRSIDATSKLPLVWLPSCHRRLRTGRRGWATAARAGKSSGSTRVMDAKTMVIAKRCHGDAPHVPRNPTPGAVTGVMEYAISYQ